MDSRPGLASVFGGAAGVASQGPVAWTAGGEVVVVGRRGRGLRAWAGAPGGVSGSRRASGEGRGLGAGLRPGWALGARDGAPGPAPRARPFPARPNWAARAGSAPPPAKITASASSPGSFSNSAG